jgi:signal transduction histidine kinase
VDVTEVINNCVIIERHSAEARHQLLLADLPEELPPVHADRVALRRVLCTIVENAIKYTPVGGRITLSASAEAGQAHIRIEDTGRGIAADDLPHIFDKFYRGRHVAAPTGYDYGVECGEPAEVPGVGLGLYLAKSVVKEIGGRINVASTPGVGSVFTISLPTWNNANTNLEAQKAEITW